MSLTNSRLTSSDVPSPTFWLSRRLAAGVIVLALAGIFLLDRATETAPVQHLYYLPIVYAAVVFGMLSGIGAAVTAIVLYHLANHVQLARPYGELDVLQIILFMAVAIVAAKLTSDTRRLHMLATTDDLTGLHNLRSFESRLVKMVSVARSARTPLVLLAMDVDRLKLINDAYGHLAGADAVRAVGQIVASTVPESTVACRYGGDEFVVAIPGCSRFLAQKIGDTLCRAVYASEPDLAGQQMPAHTLSISIGIADFFEAGRFRGVSANTSDEDVAKALFRAADEALYAAKASGRNRAHSA
jgi:diguanylate cyclase (GGDEF)-like protein